ncbi:hypothetical protein BKK51_01835 [Rodentibacter trehalosifermentans]|uniref:Uncharacterized protein n=1 Tax=Rodentibacter trehalosifermentans TaxID=1908263 RepID=A0A1V3IWJ1_9PAST|nr:hypothetical protein [Rodentibacter trehalosifermentans]OOF46630.1 hypothetical protein BKK52_11145 [Rodentibacter trehalosifermentans]OOF46641.1 hypothetical protein BKK51_01835 [Rodentibacter trehalosifermentans]
MLNRGAVRNIRITQLACKRGHKGSSKTAETLASIKTDITTDNAQAQSGKLENRFDKDKVQKELDLQREVTQEFDKTRQDIKQELYNIADKKRAEAVEIRKNTKGKDGKNGYNTKESLELERQADMWEDVAFATDLVLGGVYGWSDSKALLYTGAAAGVNQ